MCVASFWQLGRSRRDGQGSGATHGLQRAQAATMGSAVLGPSMCTVSQRGTTTKSCLPASLLVNG